LRHGIINEGKRLNKIIGAVKDFSPVICGKIPDINRAGLLIGEKNISGFLLAQDCFQLLFP